MIKNDEKPLIGFFPGFFDIGETYPLIKIAKSYQELGGKVIIFSHSGEYEYIAKEQGFKITRLEPFASGQDIKRYFLSNSDKEIIDLINNHVQIYKESGIKALVQTSSYLDCIMACKVAKIPIISVISGTLITPYFKANFGTFPDNIEGFFTQLLPQSFKNRLTNWQALHYKGPITKKFNRVAKKINIEKRFRNFQEIRMGNYTLMSDDINFLGLKPTKKFPSENYIGPILSDELFDTIEKQDYEINNFLKKPVKKILLSMGSSPVMKGLFLKILDIFDTMDYNVIATYTSLLKDNELPKLNDNILLKKFVPFVAELNKKVDLAVIHGGRGTVYNAAYSGKPAIGIPLNGEQQFNLDNLVRNGGSIRLSKTFFTEEKFIDALQYVFYNYDTYLKNSKALADKLQKSDGDKKAAERILEIVKNFN